MFKPVSWLRFVFALPFVINYRNRPFYRTYLGLESNWYHKTWMWRSRYYYIILVIFIKTTANIALWMSCCVICFTVAFHYLFDQYVLETCTSECPKKLVPWLVRNLIYKIFRNSSWCWRCSDHHYFEIYRCSKKIAKFLWTFPMKRTIISSLIVLMGS